MRATKEVPTIAKAIKNIADKMAKILTELLQVGERTSLKNLREFRSKK